MPVPSITAATRIWPKAITAAQSPTTTKRSGSTPNFAGAFANRNVAYFAIYGKEIRIDPKDASTFTNGGGAYFGKGDHDRAIADFSGAIRLDPKNATAFTGRGNAYFGKGEHDRAIADYSEAIRLDAKHATAFTGRGNAYFVKGDDDRAVADYDEAIQLDPKRAAAFTGRGFAYFVKGDDDRAIADYDEAIRLDPKDAAYAMLWRYLVREHMGRDSAAELSVNAMRLNTTNWPYAVIDFYRGRRSLDEMRAAAATANEQCESAFFAAEWQLLRGNEAEAKVTLQVVVDTCSKSFLEYPGAISELRRLGQ